MPACYKYGEMFPEDLKKILEVMPVAYLPVSPLEWHGEHIAFKCDAIIAEELMKRVWQNVGGVILPTLHLGTDGTVEEQGGKLWGMEMFAKERLPGSLYLPVDVFKSVIYHTLKFLQRNKFKLCVIYTAHLSGEQVEVWAELEEEFRNSEMRVIAFNTKKIEFPEECRGLDSNHAGFEETSEMLCINKGFVRIKNAGEKQRDKNVGLKKEVLQNANAELGERRFKFETEQLTNLINKELEKILPVS